MCFEMIILGEFNLSAISEAYLLKKRPKRKHI